MSTGSSDSIRVLHVDDEPDFADLTANLLEREDDRFSIETATSTGEALERLTADIDCLVSDYDMPERTGLDLFHAVREEYPDLPVILFTGKGSEQIASEAVSAGVTDYLQKQSGGEQYELLANRIANAVEQSRATRRAEEYQRVSTVVREINQMLVHATSHEEVNRRVCEIFADADPYVFAWIGTVDPETRRIVPQARAGDGDGYADKITITGDDSPSGQGPGGTAIREGRLAVCQDIRTDESFSQWRDRALDWGFRAVASIPLTHEDTRYGLLNVYTDQAGTFDETERDLLSELGETIGYTYHRIEIQQKYDDQYRELFADAPVMFAFTRTVDGQPVIEDCNRLFAETLGYAREELRGRRLASLYTDESAEILLSGGYDRALDGEFDRGLRELVTADGDVITTLLQATPRRGPDGGVVGTHNLYANITDERDRQGPYTRAQRRFRTLFEQIPTAIVEVKYEGLDLVVVDVNPAFEETFGYDADTIIGESLDDFIIPEGLEEEAQQINKHVTKGGRIDAREVTRLTASGPRRFLLENALYDDESGGFAIYKDITDRVERKQELERQNDRLDEFVSIVSHDLRNPLNVAATALELARSECEHPMLEKVEGAHDRMGTLIDNLLTLAREGETAADPEPVALAPLVENCWETVDTADGTLRTPIDPDATIRADVSRFKQLCENLVRNAIEHAGEDVTVTVGLLDDGFYVADDGPGIPPGDRDEAFEAGYSTSAEGTGFGLRIVEQVVESHGWTVGVTESADGGARFEISDVDIDR